MNRGKKKPAKGAPPAEAAKPNQVNLYVALSFPRWKEIVLDLLRAHFDEAKGEVAAEVMPLINKNEELKAFNKGKQVPQFAAMVSDTPQGPPPPPPGSSIIHAPQGPPPSTSHGPPLPSPFR